MLFSNILLASLCTAGVVHLPLRARQLSDASEEVAAHLAKRVTGVSHATQEWDGTFYEATVEVGSPLQNVSVTFDTGSSLLWLPGANSTLCSQHHCKKTFNVSESSTWRYRTEGNAWGGKGMWGYDTVSYAGLTVENHSVYVSKTSIEKGLGVFGQAIAPHGNQSFVQALADAGKISRPIYSINAETPITWKADGALSNVYYGGYDRAKYQGVLTTVDTGTESGYGIPLGGLKITGDDEEHTLRDLTVVLDTGGITLHLPNSTLERISQKYGGNGKFISPGSWRVACGAKPGLTYSWGETEIEVDLSSYVRPAPQGGCRLEGVTAEGPHRKTLLSGPAVISQALVIYDNERKQITIGKAKFTSETDVVPITGDIPGAVPFKKE